jgi:hypothetical protein
VDDKNNLIPVSEWQSINSAFCLQKFKSWLNRILHFNRIRKISSQLKERSLNKALFIFIIYLFINLIFKSYMIGSSWETFENILGYEQVDTSQKPEKAAERVWSPGENGDAFSRCNSDLRSAPIALAMFAFLFAWNNSGYAELWTIFM